jgi:hypothetical protein
MFPNVDSYRKSKRIISILDFEVSFHYLYVYISDYVYTKRVPNSPDITFWESVEDSGSLMAIMEFPTNDFRPKVQRRILLDSSGIRQVQGHTDIGKGISKEGDLFMSHFPVVTVLNSGEIKWLDYNLSDEITLSPSGEYRLVTRYVDAYVIPTFENGKLFAVSQSGDIHSLDAKSALSHAVHHLAISPSIYNMPFGGSGNRKSRRDYMLTLDAAGIPYIETDDGIFCCL